MPTFLASYHPQFETPDLTSLPHPQTPDHQRAYTPGGASFLTLSTCDRSARIIILTWDIMNTSYSRLFYDFRS